MMPTRTRLIEVVWTALSLWSTISALAAWRDTRLDRRAVRRLHSYRGDGPRALILDQALRTAGVRVVVQGVFTGVGALACCTRPEDHAAHRRMRGIAAAAFLLAESALTWEALTERTTRLRINRLLARRERERSTQNAPIV